MPCQTTSGTTIEVQFKRSDPWWCARMAHAAVQKGRNSYDNAIVAHTSNLLLNFKTCNLKDFSILIKLIRNTLHYALTLCHWITNIKNTILTCLLWYFIWSCIVWCFRNIPRYINFHRLLITTKGLANLKDSANNWNYGIGEIIKLKLLGHSRTCFMRLGFCVYIFKLCTFYSLYWYACNLLFETTLS